MSQGPLFGFRVTADEVAVVGTALGVFLEELADQIAALDTDSGMEEYLAVLSVQVTASRLFGSVCTSFGRSKEEVLDMLAKISQPNERNENDNP